MKGLIEIISTFLPDAIFEFNTKKLPLLEEVWGRSFKEEMLNETQKTVEISKNYSRPLNNCIFRAINKHLPEFKENSMNGFDYSYNDYLIEDKNSFSFNTASWTGNGFIKTPIHLLKKFKCDENGVIIEAFAMIVDISTCSEGWSGKKLSTNFSTIKFNKNDFSELNLIYGDLKINRKLIRPITWSI